MAQRFVTDVGSGTEFRRRARYNSDRAASPIHENGKGANIFRESTCGEIGRAARSLCDPTCPNTDKISLNRLLYLQYSFPLGMIGGVAASVRVLFKRRPLEYTTIFIFVFRRRRPNECVVGDARPRVSVWLGLCLSAEAIIERLRSENCERDDTKTGRTEKNR